MPAQIYLERNMVVIDQVGDTPVIRKVANRSFTLISDIDSGTTVIIISKADRDESAEIIGGSAMTTAITERLLRHANTYSIVSDTHRVAWKR